MSRDSAGLGQGHSGGIVQRTVGASSGSPPDSVPSATVPLEERIEDLEAQVQELQQEPADTGVEQEYVAGGFGLAAAVIAALVTAGVALWKAGKAKAEAEETRAWEIETDRDGAATVKALDELVEKFLNHEKWEVRRFRTLQKRAGGFDNRELRRALRRADGIRMFASDKYDWAGDLGTSIAAGDELWTRYESKLTKSKFQGEMPTVQEAPDVEE